MKFKAIVVPLLVLMLLPAAGLADIYTAPYYYKLNSTGITITGYTGTSGGLLTIPSIFDGHPVTSIGDSAFFRASMGSVTIPNGVTNIGSTAFYGCGGLVGVTIGSGVISIGELAFGACTNLNQVTVNAANTAYQSVDNVVFNKSQTTLILCPGGKVGSYTIPNGITNIGNAAFFDCIRLTSVTIPDGVTSIGFEGFTYCSLTNITIPNSVNSIGESAFAFTRLANVTIPNSITILAGATFSYCPLTSVTIPDSVATIGNQAFQYCTNLTSVIIPKSVNALAYNAFADCTKLTAAYFKGNAPFDDSTGFNGDTNATVYYMPGATGWSSTFGSRPAKLWNPTAQTNDANFGVRTNRFGFNIVGTSNLVIVVEACTNLASPVWLPVSTNMLNSFIGTNGTSYFSDAQWTNYARRFYRLRSP